MSGQRSAKLFSVVAVSILILVALPVAAAQTPAADKIERVLLDRFAAEGTADFIVRFAEQADLSPAYQMGWQERGAFVVEALTAAAERSQARAQAYLVSRGLAYQTFIAGNDLYVWSGDLLAANAVAALPEVRFIRATRSYSVDPVVSDGLKAAPEALDWGIVDTKADQFWSAFGKQGDGVIVASIDTGVQWDHPALDQAFGCPGDPSNPDCWEDPSNTCGGTACDNHGHGTHTMGTMVGDDDDSLTYQVGMAPNARWIACKGCETTDCSDFALNSCADWILQPGGDPANRPHVVNNSWGGAGCDAWYQAKVQAWRAAGTFPAFSGGNAGPNCGTGGSPGDYQESFASTAHDSSRSIPDFSSRGPSCFGHDPYTKPNISAPGVDVCSSVPTNGWSCNSGTSMASPHSAGAVALLWSCNPGLIGQVDQTFEILQNAADTPPVGNCDVPPDGEGNYTYGYGYLDVYQAGLLWCGQAGHLNGHVYDSSNNPLAGATVTAVPGGTTATTNLSGYYTMTLAGGIYDVTASMAGYAAQAVGGVQILPGVVTVQDFALQWVGGWIPGNPTPFEFTRFDCVWFDDGTGSSAYNQKVYCMGGRTGVATEAPNIWRYDPLLGYWSDSGADVYEDVSNYTAILLNDENFPSRGPAIYIVGGNDIDTVGAAVNYVQRYYPRTGQVEVVTSDPWPVQVAGSIVSGMGCAPVHDRIYCFGGWESITEPYFSGQTWEYDPARPAGSRWQQITTANLNPPRSYLQVAMQNGVIYAMGGAYLYTGTNLTPTNVVEALDVNNLAAGWVARASMPVATAEGRGFGMDADTLGVNAPWTGKIYVVGGGVWPGVSAEAMEYDIASDTWNQAFPDLNTARRDHAGAFVPLCTDDPTDGLPGMWVIGGRTTSDDPPYAGPEFFPFPCTLPPPPPCTPFGSSINAPVDPGIRGHMGTTDFQVINLAADAQPVTATFYSGEGEGTYQFSESLPGGGSRVYTPSAYLPADFVGTLVVSTTVGAGMGIVHLEPVSELSGNTIFPGVPDEALGNTAYTPVDSCSILYVHNLNDTAPADLAVYFFDLGGAQVGTAGGPIPPLGFITTGPISAGLPLDFAGSAVLAADQRIEVTVLSQCGGYSSFVAAPHCSQLLYVPEVPPSEPPVMEAEILLQNPTAEWNYAEIYYSAGMSQPVSLPPWGSAVVMSSLGGAGGSALIQSSRPVVAVVRFTSTVAGSEGAFAYRAPAAEEATPSAVLPVLFSGYGGWQTGNNIWVMNVGPTSSEVRIRYTTAPGDAVYWDRGIVGPGEVWRPTLPSLPAERAAAILLAGQGQPIVAVAGAYNPARQGQDRYLGYAGTNTGFPFGYQMVTATQFLTTTVGRVVFFTGLASGTEPIVYTWDFGDGSSGVGPSPSHYYPANGTFTVVLTTTNVLGFGMATAMGTVMMQGELPKGIIYLPLILRGYSGP